MVDNPNFIIIMPDQHRADVLGMVNPQVKTPNPQQPRIRSGFF